MFFKSRRLTRKKTELSKRRYVYSRLSLESLEVKAMLAAIVATDLPDYAPGDTAYIEAGGFAVGETVQFHVMHANGRVGGNGHFPWQVTDGSADDLDGAVDGKVSTWWYVDPDDSEGATFRLTATGRSTGRFAQASFTDAAFSGAIYTSLGDGTSVNQNVYAAKEHVYLNGGPQNMNSAGLPDGTYYFQVTTPSGDLLSTDDAVCRQLKVIDGVVAEVHDDGSGCAHAQGAFNPANTSMPVQLVPYDDTSNAGGEYKVWLIRQTDDNGNPIPTTYIDTDDPTVIHFNNADAKTDNFKVEDVGGDNDIDPDKVLISGIKFYDTNADGARDTNEGSTEFSINGWVISLYADDGSGVLDAGDALVGQMTTADIDGEDGAYQFSNLESGLYFVKEEAAPVEGSSWVQTTPLPGGTPGDPAVGYHAVNITDDTLHSGNDFGNVLLGEGGGHTLGFWTNKNGQALIDAADLQALRDLNLVNEDGSDFDPDSARDLRGWLRAGRAVNMAYMLSVQLAAMELNVLNGFVDPGSLIYAPGTSSANAAGFATVGDVIAEANAELASHRNTTASALDEAFRDYQEALKDALDNANNNLNFVVVPFDADGDGDIDLEDLFY